jgi:hypothetical protein
LADLGGHYVKSILLAVSAILFAGTTMTTGMAATRTVSPAHALTAAINKSIGEKWVYGSGTVSISSHGLKTVISFAGTGTTFGGVGADLQGKGSYSAKGMTFKTPYHIIVWAGRGAARVDDLGKWGKWQCFTKGTTKNLASGLQKTLSLVKATEKKAKVTSAGTAKIAGHTDDGYNASAKVTVATNYFSGGNSKSSKKETTTVLLKIWANPSTNLIDKISGTLTLAKNPKTPVKFSGMFSHYGQQVALTMPKSCPK